MTDSLTEEEIAEIDRRLRNEHYEPIIATVVSRLLSTISELRKEKEDLLTLLTEGRAVLKGECDVNFDRLIGESDHGAQLLIAEKKARASLNQMGDENV